MRRRRREEKERERQIDRERERKKKNTHTHKINQYGIVLACKDSLKVVSLLWSKFFLIACFFTCFWGLMIPLRGFSKPAF